MDNSQPLDKRVTVFIRHPDVTNKYVRLVRQDVLHRFRRGGRYRNRCSSHFQKPFGEASCIDLIVHHQHANVGERYVVRQKFVRVEPTLRTTQLLRLRVDCPERQKNNKGRPLPYPVAFDLNLSAMKLDELLDDSQSKSQSSMSTSRRRISLSKPFENIRQELRGE